MVLTHDADVSGSTRLFAVLGSPIAHSLSPLIHNTSFAHLGIDADYRAFEVPAERIGEAIDDIRALGIAGCNLTMPLKRAVLPYLDGLSPAAELVGAVNTIERDGERLIGHNTDGGGMTRAIREAGGQISGSRVVLAGAGGAALAICAQFGLEGAAHVSVLKRANETFAAAREEIERLAGATDCSMSLVDWGDGAAVSEEVSSADILINATPIGMGEKSESSPFSADDLREGQFVADAVYHPRVTRLLTDARERGATPVEGIGMLLWQALLAEEIWLGDELAASGKQITAEPILPVLANAGL
ncbi:MAG: shikimate dehydrogenase [Actinomycetaceae bacterium]|nr:shikimate dehydrogenase [Actinomycetaceae bacterium]